MGAATIPERLLSECGTNYSAYGNCASTSIHSYIDICNCTHYYFFQFFSHCAPSTDATYSADNFNLVMGKQIGSDFIFMKIHRGHSQNIWTAQSSKFWKLSYLSNWSTWLGAIGDKNTSNIVYMVCECPYRIHTFPIFSIHGIGFLQQTFYLCKLGVLLQNQNVMILVDLLKTFNMMEYFNNFRPKKIKD